MLFRSWLHQDQRKEDTRLSVQGILNLMPSGEHDAGFICVPGSHVDYTDAPPNMKSDWIMLPENSPLQQQARKLIVPERSILLFNSKLLHANTGMNPRHTHPRGDKHLNRLSAYITFVPKERQSVEVRNKRIQGYHEGKSTSHWADRFEPKRIPFFLDAR